MGTFLEVHFLEGSFVDIFEKLHEQNLLKFDQQLYTLHQLKDLLLEILYLIQLQMHV